MSPLLSNMSALATWSVEVTAGLLGPDRVLRG
jgi:hypothetical protein